MKTIPHGVSLFIQISLAGVVVLAGLLSIIGTGSNTRSILTTACTGPHQYVRTGSQVILDGRCSDFTDSAADDALMHYEWYVSSKPDGSNLGLTLGTRVITTFIADVDGDYVIGLRTGTSLTVDDDSTFINITAYTGNAPPMAEAGAYQEVATGDTTQLNGSGRDADDDTLSYQWSFQPTSAAGSLSSSTSPSPTLVADSSGDYLLDLVVNDGAVNSQRNSILVRSRNTNLSLPVAVVGTDRFVTTGDQVMLDASNSYSAYDRPLAYNWRIMARPAGSNASLTDNSAEQPSFTADVGGYYLLRLRVNDGLNDSSRVLDDVYEDRMVITAGINQPPIADGGVDQSISTGSLVSLDGGASTDPEMATLSYHWSLIKQPAGSTASLSSPDTQTTQLTPDRDGNYLVSLRVNDGIDDSAPDVVRITASSLSGGSALTLVGSLPFAPSGAELPTWIQVDTDGSDSVRVTSPDDVNPGNFATALAIGYNGAGSGIFSAYTGWSIISPATLVISDTTTPVLIAQRSADAMYYKFIVDFTALSGSFTVQIDGLQAWRCGVNPSDCP